MSPTNDIKRLGTMMTKELKHIGVGHAVVIWNNQFRQLTFIRTIIIVLNQTSILLFSRHVPNNYQLCVACP